MMSHRRRQAGFTLVELLVVLAILGLLAATVGAPMIKRFGVAKNKAAQLQVHALMTALEGFYLDTGGFPEPTEGLKALVDRPAGVAVWNGPYVSQRESLIDPWGIPYKYLNPGRTHPVDVVSFGADKVEGGTGENADVASW